MAEVKCIGFGVTDLDSVPGCTAGLKRDCGYLLSEPVSTSVQWIVVRIKGDNGRGKRAGYNRQVLVSCDFVAPGWGHA